MGVRLASGESGTFFVPLEWLRSSLKRMKKVNKNGLSGYASNPLFTFSVTTKKKSTRYRFSLFHFLNFFSTVFFSVASLLRSEDLAVP